VLLKIRVDGQTRNAYAFLNNGTFGRRLKSEKLDGKLEACSRDL
jgi:hypothetical protein